MTPVCTCTLTPTVAHEAWGPLELAGITGYWVQTRKQPDNMLYIRVMYGTRMVGHAVAQKYAHDTEPFTDIWGAEIVLNGYTWLVSGCVGSGVLEFASPTKPRTLADVEAGK